MGLTDPDELVLEDPEVKLKIELLAGKMVTPFEPRRVKDLELRARTMQKKGEMLIPSIWTGISKTWVIIFSKIRLGGHAQEPGMQHPKNNQARSEK